MIASALVKNARYRETSTGRIVRYLGWARSSDGAILYSFYDVTTLESRFINPADVEEISH